MKLLKASFLLAASAILPSMANAGVVTPITPPGSLSIYDSPVIVSTSADGAALIGSVLSDYIFWSATTGRLTGTAAVLSVPNSNSYYFVGLNATGTKLYGTIYDTSSSSRIPIIWNLASGTYVNVLASVGSVTSSSFGSRWTYGGYKQTVTADASRAYGNYTQAGVQKIFCWDQTAGVTTDLIGSINTGNNNCSVQSMSSDGNKITGLYYTAVAAHSFYWSQTSGAIDIGNSMGFSANTQVTVSNMCSSGAYAFVSKYASNTWT